MLSSRIWLACALLVLVLLPQAHARNSAHRARPPSAGADPTATAPPAKPLMHYPKPAAGKSASGGPEVLFTFDDGPHEKYTPLVLASLRAHNVKALFFVAGWRVAGEGPLFDQRRAVLKDVVAEGHAIGNHTVNHARMCSVSAAKAEREIDENASLLRRLIGRESVFFRTPYGTRCRRLDRMLEARGLRHLHWDMDPHEFAHHDSRVVERYLVGEISRLRGRAVILLHDTQPASMRALPRVLDWIATENARRVAAGEVPIRIIGPDDLLRPRLEATAPVDGSSFPSTVRGSAGWLWRMAPHVTRRLLAPIALVPASPDEG